ncbi:MAG TPA: proline racemase family protein [candidate division Zixibacteria bacterium]|nr:proline racemase family protein [candidate division Zixibacteria bacterium]
MNTISKKLSSLINWMPPDDWLKIVTIDAHSAGEPLRIIVSGFPEIKGKTILEYRRFVKENYDHLRTSLLWEPRGHADMYGCLITPSVSQEADFGVLFLHNEGYSTMCGHAIITLTKVLIETGFLQMKSPETEVKIDTPAGLVTSYAKIENNRVKSVYFHNVPSFVLALDELVTIQSIGKIRYDLAFGGAFYAFVNAKEIGLSLIPENFQKLIQSGVEIKKAIIDKQSIVHPFEKELSFLYGIIFVDEPLSDEADSRNVCVFANGEIDRCPTGTGVSARMAIHHMRGEIGIGEQMVIESIIDSRYKGSIVKAIEYGPYKAVIPRVEGTAHIIGRNEFFIDPNDSLKNGFILR